MQCNAMHCAAVQCNCNAIECNHKHIITMTTSYHNHRGEERAPATMHTNPYPLREGGRGLRTGLTIPIGGKVGEDW